MKRKTFLLLCAAGALGLLWSAPVRADDGLNETEGQITALDTSATPPTVTITASDQSSVTLNITTSTVIRVGHTVGSLSDLATGLNAEAAYDPTSLDAAVIHVEKPRPTIATGVVVSYDPGTGAIGIDTNNDGTADVTVTADANTVVRAGDATFGPDQLGELVGLTVQAAYDPTSLVASRIQVEAQDGQVQELSGQIAAVDPNALTLSLTTSTGSANLVLLAGAQIRSRDRKLAVTDLQVGQNIRVQTLTNGAGDLLAVRIQVQAPRPQHVEGTLSAVGTNTLTVAARSGSVTLTVDGNTVIRLNGKIAPLTDLSNALANGTVRVQAQYLASNGVNTAVRVDAQAKTHHGGGGGGNGGGQGGGNGGGSGHH